MLFHMQLAVQILHADVVQVEVVARSYGADAVENILRPTSARNGMHHDIGIGQDFAYSRSHRGGNLIGTLEREIAFQSDGNVGEKSIPGFAKTDTIDLEHAIDGSDAIEELTAHANWGSIQ